MAGMKIKKGDSVVVLTGKDKGKEGEVSRAIPSAGKVIVDGVNVAKRHQKADPGHHAGRDHRQGHAHPGGQRRHPVPELRRHPGRLPLRPRRHQGTGRARSAGGDL